MTAGTARPVRNRIAELRLAQKLTQVELAKLVDIDMSSVSKHEAGERVPSAETIERYAKVFKVSTLEIFMHPDELGQ